MKKSTMLACAGIVIVSFAPFLGGCAQTSIATEPDPTPTTQQITVDTTANADTAALMSEKETAFTLATSHS